MSRRKRRRERDVESKGSSNQGPPPKPSRLRLALIASIGAIAIGGAWLLRPYLMPPSPPSIVAETAAEAAPEVAELLYEAEGAVLELGQRFPDTVDALDTMALLHSRFGKVEEATRLWRECAEKDPTFVSAYFQLGSIERDGGRNAEATQYFRRAYELDRTAAHFAIHLARSLVTEGNLEEAVQLLEEVRGRQPDSVAALSVLGDAYLQLKQYEKARDVFARTVELAPELTSPHYGLGTACLQLGDKETAKEQMAIFQKLKARDAQAHRDELKDTQLGLRNVKTNVAEIETTVAKSYIAFGYPQPAEELLRRAFQLDPSAPEPARVLAWLLEREGRIEEAVETYREAAAALPDDFTLQLGLGQLLARIGRVDEAEKSFRRMVELTPNNATAHVMLAEFYLGAARDAAQAAEAAQKAVDLAPTADNYFLLARAYYDSGAFDRATSAIDQAIALEPGRREYLQLKDAIGNR